MCFFKCGIKCGVGATRLSKFALGFAFGTIKGLWLLLLAWSAWLTGYGTMWVDHISQFFSSYGPTFVGGILGGILGFICGFIGGFIIAGLYNLCLRCCQKNEPESKK